MKVGESYRRSDVGDTWDAVVIGSGIGGLTAGGFLAQDGKRVLVLERHTTAGGCTQVFRRAGYEWDAGLHYMGEVHRANSGLRRIFDHVTGGALRWAPMPDVYNRVFIGNRLYEYPSGAAKFAERMKGYFPAETDAIDRYLELVHHVNRSAQNYFGNRALPPEIADSTYEAMSGRYREYSDRTVLDVLRELTANQELIAVLCGHYGDYSMTPGRASFGMHAMLIRHYLDGANFPVGGSGRLAETIGDMIGSAGGAILVGAEVASVLLDETGAACGVAMTDGRVFRAPLVISDAGAVATLTGLLPPEAAGLPADSEEIGPSLPWVVLNIGIRESAEALNLPQANIWAHAGPDIDAEVAAFEADPHHRKMPLYFLSFPSAKDPLWDTRYPGRATVDICALTAWSLFEPYADTAWKHRGAGYDELKERLTAELLDQVLRFCPQLKGKIDHVELGTPLTFNHFLGRKSGDFMSFAHTPTRFRQRWLGPRTSVPNLFLCGQDAASAGVSGAMVGGAIAVSAALGRDVLQDLPKQ